ncbi:Bifunctional F420 biosynthesis protein FbiB [Candidatus Lokiarchaeum ossiferum]|uniref:Bifunctional F420 biosynthesis protein FbiB n=1 Tax=Candidatus Lokiarchaeum ossiferum TaxID=2951803 RepID=A0ABY6HZC9_9ARCH|nr:Bifunctional F420 biosynthesis protein FbiB [Candidatus Lokiarchaeum sp. B-35]
MNETIKTLKYRRSVRAYQDKPIPPEIIDTLIHSAMRAPTAGNMMMYSIIEVTKQEVKEKLVKSCDNQPFIAKAPLVLVFLADMQRWYDYFTHCKVPQYCKDHELTFRGPQESDLLLASCDALIAAQSAVIAAEALGIGSCYIGDIMENIETQRELLGLPMNVFPITMICFGYPKSDQAPEKRKLISRFPQQYIHFHDKYKQLSAEEFEDMYSETLETRYKTRKFLGEATNLGQHYYLMKTGSDYSHEMVRSVKVALEDWKKTQFD